MGGVSAFAPPVALAVSGSQFFTLHSALFTERFQQRLRRQFRVVGFGSEWCGRRALDAQRLRCGLFRLLLPALLLTLK